MDKIIDDDGVVNLNELSKYNGKTDIENFKTIMEFLRAKAEVTGRTQTGRITFTGVTDE